MADINHPQYKHGLARTPIYNVWSSIKERCDTPSTTSYFRYGGRGITYDAKWKTFEGFLEDMRDGYKSGLSIERVDNGKGYTKSNCRWATWEEQCNNRRTSRFLEYKGRKQTVSQWSKEIGVHSRTIRARIDVLGWPIGKALEAHRG